MKRFKAYIEYVMNFYANYYSCLLYTSDAADDVLRV